LKTLKTQVSRIKQRSSTKAVSSATTNNTNSGFLKPVKISSDMAKFTGWNPEEPHSRVEVTKYICDYIKENNLQNPADRREIQPDSKLQKLLGLKNKEDEGLKYYSLQTHLKKHFVKKD
jgi:chromatin remodeling complex protein RSC6